CAATFVRAVGRPNNDPLDRELHRCIAEERDVARFTAALGHQRRFSATWAHVGLAPNNGSHSDPVELTLSAITKPEQSPQKSPLLDCLVGRDATRTSPSIDSRVVS